MLNTKSFFKSKCDPNPVIIQKSPFRPHFSVNQDLKEIANGRLSFDRANT